MFRHLLPQVPALIATCDECSPALRSALPGVVFKDVIGPVALIDGSYCCHCSWCGDALWVPAARSRQRKRCVLHGDLCPDYLPQGTVQGAEIIQILTQARMELTTQGWDEIAEELQVAGPGGIDIDGVVTRLCEHPGLILRH